MEQETELSSARRGDIVIRIDRSLALKALTLGLCTVLLGAPTYLAASTVSDPLTNFVAGTPIVAADMNAAMNALAVAVNDNYDRADAAQAAADDAETTADDAQTFALLAQTAADTAQTAADDAQTAADNAQTTAADAQTFALFAQTAADDAQTTADDAQIFALIAQTTADGAQAAADAAQATADANDARISNIETLLLTSICGKMNPTIANPIAIAFINANGTAGYQQFEDVLISGLEDTDDSGTVSPGDRILRVQYPNTFSVGANKCDDFGVTTTVLSSGASGTIAAELVTVTDGSTSYEWESNAVRQLYRENNGNNTVIKDVHNGETSQSIKIKLGSPGDPESALNKADYNGNNTDSAFLDVIIF